jgi:hypothetical protein
LSARDREEGPEGRGLTRRIHHTNRHGRPPHRPARELRKLDARAEIVLRRGDGQLTRLCHLGLCEAQREPCGLASADLPLNDPQHLLLECQNARGEEGTVALHQGPVKRRVNIAMNGPAQLLDLGVGEVA